MKELDWRTGKGIKFHFLSSDILKVKYLREGLEAQLKLPLSVMKDNHICYRTNTASFLTFSGIHQSKPVGNFPWASMRTASHPGLRF